MIYPNTVGGVFISRPNRFIAQVEINGKDETAHVKNTGRCRELLIPGVRVILQKSDNPARKTRYDLISVWKGERLINMDSQSPNKVFLEYLRSGKYMDDITLIRPESKHGRSRFDFYVEAGGRKHLIEVKGVTLEEDGIAMFPDAPTERGVKHLNELSKCVQEGYEAHAVFVIQMNDIRYFTPNCRTHQAFGIALANAAATGVKTSAFDCEVTENSLVIGKPVPMRI